MPRHPATSQLHVTVLPYCGSSPGGVLRHGRLVNTVASRPGPTGPVRDGGDSGVDSSRHSSGDPCEHHPARVDHHDRRHHRLLRVGVLRARAQAPRADRRRVRALVGLLHRSRATVRCRCGRLLGVGIRRRVLRRVPHREGPVDRQPVRVPHRHDRVRGAEDVPAESADDRHRHRPHHARRLHRRRGGADRELLVGVLPLRRAAAVPRVPTGVRARRVQPRRRLVHAPRAPRAAGQRRVRRRPAHGEEGRSPLRHPHAPRHRRDRLHRPRLRRRLDPRDLRAHRGGLPRLHGERLRTDGSAPALLPHRRSARAPRTSPRDSP